MGAPPLQDPELPPPPRDPEHGLEKGEASRERERARETAHAPSAEAPLGDPQPSAHAVPLGEPLPGLSAAAAQRCPRVFLSPDASPGQGPGRRFLPEPPPQTPPPAPESPRTPPPRPPLAEPHPPRTHVRTLTLTRTDTQPRRTWGAARRDTGPTARSVGGARRGPQGPQGPPAPREGRGPGRVRGEPECGAGRREVAGSSPVPCPEAQGLEVPGGRSRSERPPRPPGAPVETCGAPRSRPAAPGSTAGVAPPSSVPRATPCPELRGPSPRGCAEIPPVSATGGQDAAEDAAPTGRGPVP